MTLKSSAFWENETVMFKKTPPNPGASPKERRNGEDFFLSLRGTSGADGREGEVVARPHFSARSLKPGDAPVAPKSVDTVRVIRRSLRCFVFGLLGIIPVVGLGLAYQAVRLYGKVVGETSQHWEPPKMRWHWMSGLFCLWGYDQVFGWTGFLSVFAIFTWLITNQVRRSLAQPVGHFWNPAQRHLHWGVALAYAGYFGSISLAALLALRLSEIDW
jgi:hypothetical protein